MPDAAYVVVDAFFASADESDGERQAQTITDTDHLLWALETLQQHRAQVVNMSLVGPSDPAVHAMIRKMAQAGTVFVAAAGNGGPAGIAAFPAAYAEVIAVTAVDRNRHSYAEANHGTYIDVAAPGVRVWTALPGERQGFLSGTSFAVPFVTAIIAASYDAAPMKTAGSDKRRTLSPKEEAMARMAIEKLGAGEAGTRDSIFGFGLVHAPANCAPSSRPEAVAAVERSPAREAAAKAGDAPWQMQVHRASAFRPQPSGD
jgi:subtilisin family serine protease